MEPFSIYLLEEHWGKGLGRQLMRAVMHRIAAHDSFALIAWVLVDNQRGRRFYERMGFMPDGGAPKPAQWPGVFQVRYRMEILGR